ncbi:PTS sugar transporter subunit IIA [Streptomyces sp. CRN 30]|uniref:PTS sugar transporter subunit IIA n=1 Tax=Streptomyces sp. CRN 30 TaxID=3075613 RepID=UPI002A7EEB60|nr:PTS sugar transporter subunit IIA [Streptomyces sp. CRN 30]
MNALTALLSPAAVRLDVDAGDWRAAIRAAGQALVDDGISTADYTAEMLANVEENGPYIVIAPGLAFAHARPSPAVLRTGLSWVRLARPVPFGHEANDPVGLVVALAATDSAAHTDAMAALARVLADPATGAALERARTPEEVLGILGGERPATAETDTRADTGTAPGAASQHKILTVCGNGVGTSLFLKNTLEQVLDHWGWSRHVTVEATDTISAKGKASEAVAILTSREIARTLGDVGVPVKVVQDFTSTAEVDAVLRDTYSV